jgi:hypothetical protein
MSSFEYRTELVSILSLLFRLKRLIALVGASTQTIDGKVSVVLKLPLATFLVNKQVSRKRK